MEMSTNKMLKKLISSIAQTRPDEIDCANCFINMNQFVEMEQKKLNAYANMPLVNDHLLKCKDCFEEYKALQKAIRSIQD